MTDTSDRVMPPFKTHSSRVGRINGIGELAAAVMLRQEMTGEWPLPTAGLLSLVVAVLLIEVRGTGVPALVWLIAPSSIRPDSLTLSA
jgi:hypothetical protein